MIKLLLRLFTLVIVLIIGIHFFAYGSIIYYRAFYPHQTTFMQLRLYEAQKTQTNIHLQYIPVPYNKISKNIKKALIASEDANFVGHDGFDLKGIKRALKKNQKSGKIKAGGSTISQQLVKNLLLWDQKSYFRKIEEAIVTAMMESILDKNRIFSLYLNVIEWGEGIFGIEAASQFYYKKSATDLNQNEAARLAAMVTNPRFYQKNLNSQHLLKKSNIIRKRMGVSLVPQTEQE